MQNIPYASVVGSLMYAQACTRPNIAYIVGMLRRYLSNPELDHWKAAKRVMRYLQRTKDFQTGHAVFTENKRFYAHIQKIGSVGDHWLF